jgi:hypothetical protein
MALPELGVQVIQYLKTVDFAEFNLHFEELLVMRDIDHLLLNFF